MATRTTTTKKAAARKATTTKRTTGSRKSATRPNGTSPAQPSTKASTEVLNATGLARLGKGGLEELVLDHIKKHPRVEFTSTELSHKLNRSNGAIQNTLEKFVEQGTAERTNDAPRRYRYAGAKSARRTGNTNKKAR